MPSVAWAQLHGTDPDWLASPLPVAQAEPAWYASGAVANNMAVTPDGRVLILYTESQGNLEKRYLVGSDDGGLTWDAPAPTLFAPSELTVANTRPSMDLGTDGRLHVVWGSRVEQAMFHVWADVGTLQWSDTMRIGTTDKERIGFCQVSTDRSGRVHVYWHEGDTQTSETAEVMYTRSVDGGLTWQPQQMISADDGRHSAFPSGDFVGTEGDTLAIAWRDSLGQTTPSVQDWDVQLAISTDGGATWQPPLTVAGGAGMQSDPALVVDRNGTIHIAYHEYPQLGGNLAARVWYIRTDDLGLSWGAGAVQISEPGIQSHLVKEAYDHANDRVWYFYKDQRDYIPPFDRRADVQAVHIGGDGTISAPEFISDADSNEVGLHNFKVGPDGIPHGHFFIMPYATDSTHLWYTHRDLITAAPAHVAADALRAWPVPTTEWVMLSRTVGPLYLTDVHGRLLTTINGPVCSIDLSAYPQGLYLARCDDQILRLLKVGR